MREPMETFTSEQAFDIERLCRYFSELSPQPMIAVEGNTHIVRYVNSAFLELSGIKASELIGRCFSEAVPEGEANGCHALLSRVFTTGTAEVLEEQEHGKTPPNYWTYSVWPILGMDETPVGVVVQIHDTSEVAIFRRQVTEMNKQLLLSAARQHELIEEAHNANRLKDDFLATLSHELRTPLTVVIGWADMLTDTRLEPAQKERAVDTIRRNARAQVTMINDLLDVSRITTGKLHLQAQAVDLAKIAASSVDSLRLAANAKDINIEMQIVPSTRQVSGDPDRLQQVLWNLVSNAIKFSPRGGAVTMRICEVESNFEISVSDNGKGIAPEFLPYVFDRFRQADSSTTRVAGGLGLGLSIARQLVELHGGTVRVESDGEDLGSIFKVFLPLMPLEVEKQDIEYSMPTNAAPPDFECPQHIKGLRVLIVDDEADTREMLQFVLEGCGVQVKTAGSAREALDAVANEVFDVLISDIGIPDEDGYSLIAKVHALSKERGGKIPAAAALTAYAGEEDRICALHSGFQMHVPKPISPNELVAIVADLAGRTA